MANSLIYRYLTFALLTVPLWCATGAFNNSVTSPMCKGKWVQGSSDYSLFVKSGEMPYRPNFDMLCPAETLMHNCYFHGSNRSHNVSARRWVLDSDSECVDFTPLRFASEMRNTTIHLMGDSTMMQLFTALVCSLYKLSYSEATVHFQHHQGGTNEVFSKI